MGVVFIKRPRIEKISGTFFSFAASLVIAAAHERLQRQREVHTGFMNPTGSEVSPSVARSASASP